MRFASLASGSRGNALLVEFGDTLLMIDCGLTLRDVEERLGALGRCPADVAGVLVTHEHHDHLRGVAPFARRHDVPVWMTPGTARAADGFGDVNVLGSHRPFRIGGIAVEPFPVPHDAREPCQFVLRAGGRRLGVLTDTGHVTRHIRERLSRCDALALECNHDAEELARSSYPPSVKMRVASPYGHLNNAQAAALVDSCMHTELQWVVAMHVSERNNSPERVRGALAPALGPARIPLHVAEQDRVSGWLEIA